MNFAQIYERTSPLVIGYSMRSRYITDSLVELGARPTVFSSPIHVYENKEDEFGGVHYVHLRHDSWNLVKRFPVIREKCIVDTIFKQIDDRWDSSFRLVDAHSSILNGLAGLKLARKRNVPFIYEIRAFWEDAAVDQGKTREGSLRYNLTRNMETDVVKKADWVTVICEGLKDDLIRRGIGEEKITVIPNGVDTRSFKPAAPDKELADRLGLGEVKVIGFIGTFFNFEGLELLIRALKLMLLKRKDIKLVLVGGGQEEKNIKKLINETGMSKHVIIPGRVDHEEIQKYYSVMDVMVYPRLSKRITELVTPLKPLEAMALRKLVIASDVGGLKELVSNGHNGLLFKAQDAGDLAKKCLYALENPSQMQNIAKEARSYVERERNWLEICRKYLTIFKELGVMS